MLGWWFWSSSDQLDRFLFPATVAASMTAEIVVRKPTRTVLLWLNTGSFSFLITNGLCEMRKVTSFVYPKLSRSIAKLASALTPKLAVATAAEKTVQGSVNSRTTKGMATVTTKISTRLGCAVSVFLYYHTLIKYPACIFQQLWLRVRRRRLLSCYRQRRKIFLPILVRSFKRTPKPRVW